MAKSANPDQLASEEATLFAKAGHIWVQQLSANHITSCKLFDANSHTEWRTVQIQISWLLQKPADLNLHYLGSAGQGLKYKPF